MTAETAKHGRRIEPLLDASASHDFADRAARPINIQGTLARSPELASAFAALGLPLLVGQRSLSRRDKELVILRVGWKSQSVYEFGQHTLFGRAEGLTDKEIGQLAGAPGEWPPNDAALIAFVDELCENNDVTDQTWAALASRFTDADLVELLLLAGYYRMVSGLLNAAGVELESWTPGWPE